MKRFPADRRLPQALEETLAVWIARNIESYPFDPEVRRQLANASRPGSPCPRGHPGARIKV